MNYLKIFKTIKDLTKTIKTKGGENPAYSKNFAYPTNIGKGCWKLFNNYNLKKINFAMV